MFYCSLFTGSVPPLAPPPHALLCPPPFPWKIFAHWFQFGINTWEAWESEPRKYLCSSVGKESACNAGDLGSIPGSGRYPRVENGNPPQHSCLGNLVAWWATVHGVIGVSHDLATKSWEAQREDRAGGEFGAFIPFDPTLDAFVKKDALLDSYSSCQVASLLRLQFSARFHVGHFHFFPLQA